MILGYVCHGVHGGRKRRKRSLFTREARGCGFERVHDRLRVLQHAPLIEKLLLLVALQLCSVDLPHLIGEQVEPVRPLPLIHIGFLQRSVRLLCLRVARPDPFEQRRRLCRPIPVEQR